MSQISQCDCESCYNMEFDNTVYHVDNETEAFLLEHFSSSFKCRTMIDDICASCAEEFNSDYEDLFVLDVYDNLSINEKYRDNHDLLEK